MQCYAKKVIGRSKKQSKPWIGDKTWEKIKERKEAKLKMEGARSERLKQRRREEYDAKDKEVKRSAREELDREEGCDSRKGR